MNNQTFKQKLTTIIQNLDRTYHQIEHNVPDSRNKIVTKLKTEIRNLKLIVHLKLNHETKQHLIYIIRRIDKIGVELQVNVPKSCRKFINDLS